MKKIIIFFFFCCPLFANQLPLDYEKKEACEKRDILWEKVVATPYTSPPKFAKFGVWQLIAMGVQEISKKKTRFSDVAPSGWKKYLHRRGSVAKVEIRSIGDHPYTGVFKGAECAILRLSLTYRPTKKRDVAPGLALKILRDGVDSANVSALYTLEGQDKNYNFFENPLSNIVPMGSGIGLKLVHSLFRSVSDYPEELVMKHFSEVDENGKKVSAPRWPRQIFFVPNPALSKVERRSEHDVRTDFELIKEGTSIYKIYALPDSEKDFDYSEYKREDIPKFVDKSVLIGEIVSKSEFLSSEFGDTGIFFRHELRAKTRSEYDDPPREHP